MCFIRKRASCQAQCRLIDEACIGYPKRCASERLGGQMESNETGKGGYTEQHSPLTTLADQREGFPAGDLTRAIHADHRIVRRPAFERRALKRHDDMAVHRTW